LLLPAVPELSTSLIAIHYTVAHLTTRYQLVFHRAALGYKQNIAAAFEYDTTSQQACHQLSRSRSTLFVKGVIFVISLHGQIFMSSGPFTPLLPETIVCLTRAYLLQARGYLTKPSFSSLDLSRVSSLNQISIVIRSSQSFSSYKSLPICASLSSP
jgi:hypothetical protein